jgi:AcrR family transcriptional regulator
MAKTPRRNPKRGAAAEEAAGPSARDRIIDALMALLAERRFADISLADIAEAADVPVTTLREHFDGKLGILAGFTRRIDLAVLAGGAPDMSVGPRDRLFEAEMRRFDALAPHKPALHRLARSAKCDPGLACALHALATRSQKWTLVAAGVHHGGIKGRVALEGAILVHLEAMRTWFEDDDEDSARTMATLDRALRRGERAMRVLGDICSFAPRFMERGRRMRDSGRDARGAGSEA